MDVKQSLGSNIKRYRQLNGLSQEEFSEMLDISQQTLSRIERGINFVTSETLEKIPAILNINLYELFISSKDQSNNELIDNISLNLNRLKSNKDKLKCIDKLVKEIMLL